MLKNKFLFLAALLFVPSLAFSKVGTRNLQEELKHNSSCFEYPLAGSATISIGLNGLIWANTASTAGDASPDFTGTGTIGTFLYPSTVTVDLIDESSDSTLACSSMVLVGKDQFGAAKSETLSSLTETAQDSTTVWSDISSITVTDCTGAETAGDAIQIKQSQEIGLGRKIRQASDVEAACIVDSSDSDNVKCAAQNDTTATDIESAVDLSSHSIDISTAMFRGATKVAHADGDLVCLRLRSSWRAY